MRFHRLLDDVLGRRSKVELLRLLIRSPAAYSGRDLARTLGVDHKTCHAALRELVDQGIVRRVRTRAAHLYSLNGGHAVVQEMLVPLFEAEAALVDRYVGDLRRLLRVPVEAIILFGSVARAEGGPRSDVDLLVVARDRASAKALDRHLDEATIRLIERYATVPQILVTDASAFSRKAAGGRHLFAEILRTGRVVFGKSFRELLRNVGA